MSSSSGDKIRDIVERGRYYLTVADADFLLNLARYLDKSWERWGGRSVKPTEPMGDATP